MFGSILKSDGNFPEKKKGEIFTPPFDHERKGYLMVKYFSGTSTSVIFR